MYLFLCIQPATKSYCFASSPPLQKQLGQDWQISPVQFQTYHLSLTCMEAALHGPNYNELLFTFGAFLKMTSICHLNLTSLYALTVTLKSILIVLLFLKASQFYFPLKLTARERGC